MTLAVHRSYASSDGSCATYRAHCHLVVNKESNILFKVVCGMRISSRHLDKGETKSQYTQDERISERFRMLI